jgi:hypothetical protein
MKREGFSCAQYSSTAREKILLVAAAARQLAALGRSVAAPAVMATPTPSIAFGRNCGGCGERAPR